MHAISHAAMTRLERQKFFFFFVVAVAVSELHTVVRLCNNNVSDLGGNANIFMQNFSISGAAPVPALNVR